MPLGKYHDLLNAHLKAGKGRPAGSSKFGLAWTDADFSAALSAAPGQAQRRSDVSVSNWRKGTYRPGPDVQKVIEETLFPETDSSTDAETEQKNSFHRAYIEAKTRSAQHKHDNSIDFPHPSQEWLITRGPEKKTVADLIISAPRRTNEPNTFIVQTFLMFGVSEVEYNGCDIEISLKDCQLIIDEGGFQRLPDSFITEKSDTENLQQVVGGLKICGPRDNKGRLVGTVMNNDNLMQIETIGRSASELQIYLVANRRSFKVDYERASFRGDGVGIGEISEDTNTMHILNAVVFDHGRRDASGRHIVAEVKLKKVEEVEDEDT